MQKVGRRCGDGQGLLYTGTVHSLHLTDNLLCATETLHHLLALFPPTDSVVAFLQEVIKLGCLVHVFEKLLLHALFGVSVFQVSECRRVCERRQSYWTSVNMMAFGTMSIIVLRTMLK